MSTPVLNVAATPTGDVKKPASITQKQFAALTAIEQIRQAFQPDGRLAAFIGLWLGSSLPVMTFGLVHFVLPYYPEKMILNWGIALGGLVYSAPKVYRWGVLAWGRKLEAAGMVLLLEGIMTFIPGLLLPTAALIQIVFINGVYSACSLQIRK